MYLYKIKGCWYETDACVLIEKSNKNKLSMIVGLSFLVFLFLFLL
jgi:hypothetical protein